MMQKFSPNWYWQQLGYRIERHGYFRNTFDNQGRVVIDRSRYESVNNDCMLGLDYYTFEPDYYTLELSISRWLYESLTENPEIESIN